ncbi:flagellar assembly protein FliW [Parachitinimonas caeni]|uniref:Flagellar assembly factor FliW n=1 Tax=Parachitinimonas caeni TaxID=3031301 RepID=A0ABT7E275_9NEIS|nr:flagellar assembly protein FliW [Parachitinimonas caeni]MDK2125515.1 flagellar assembly protein FliW [Parachitinimonas caeni]
MQIVTPRFGPIEVDESTIITFPRGLPGFEHCHRFKLLHEESPTPIALWLQSLDDTEIVFSVIEPARLAVQYEVALSDEESALLNVKDPADLVLLLLLLRDIENTTEIKANTQAPVILNTASRLALQKMGMRCQLVFSE